MVLKRNSMKEKILITGGNGLIAQHFYELYKEIYDIQFVSRNPKYQNDFFWDPEKGIIDPNALKNVNHIINLAGASLAGKRWTKNYKKEILHSRIDSTSLIINALNLHNITVKSLISASAVGIYGAIKSPYILNEITEPGDDFAATVCNKWENEAKKALRDQTAKRLVIPRLGIVLCHYGGALPKMLMGSKLGITAVFGSGNQFIPWVHINDVCRFFHYAIQTPNLAGTYNLVAPQFVTYQQLIEKSLKRLGLTSNKIIHIPSLVGKLAIGEGISLLTSSSKIDSSKVRSTGFNFLYPNIDKALRSLLI